MQPTTELATVTTQGGVGVITINNPPVNALGPGVAEGILAAVEKLSANSEARAIVLIGGGKTFIAGADIKEFGKITSGKKRDLGTLRSMLAALEDCTKPTVAAIHGTAFGAGLETAMACHYRVAAPSAQVGQPEVKLGLIPGAGGTQRLPRLAGLAKAAELCAFGGTMSANEAMALGVVDQVIDGDLRAEAVRFAGSVGKVRRTRDIVDRLGDRCAIANVREQVEKKMAHLLAARHAVEAVAAAGRVSFEDGLAVEA